MTISSSRFIRPAIALLAALAMATAHAEDKRPNILLIVADDMGYADIGSYGGDIRTPNLDALAARGLRATNYHVGPTCSPTRSMLFSGVDNHVAGLGNMHEYVGPKQQGKPGYEGHLNDRVASMVQVLRDGGYHTYMAGKWHLGEDPHAWPAAKGFERDFSLMQGGGSNWDDMGYPNPAHPNLTYTLNGKHFDKLPKGHFSTQAFTDFIIKSVDEQKADGKPFFAYLSYQAVHSPFAVPEDWLEKYRGRYDQGYDAIRATRIARMKEMGLVGKDAQPFPRLPQIPAWDSLPPEQQKHLARRMEVYAAMLENMDFHIGRILDHLRQTGQLDNTLVLFMSDNGAEPTELLQLAQGVDPKMKAWLEKNWDTRIEACGRPKSICDYGPGWAQAGSGPYRLFKGFVTEGGIRVPLIVAGPGVKHDGSQTGALLHVTDIAPTLFEVAGVEHPSASNPKLAPLAGKSMMPLLAGKADSVRSDQDWLGWELFGNRAILQGDWKVVSILKEAGGSGEWQLFNLHDDPGETRDLSKEQPAKRADLAARWDDYAKLNGVILTGDGPYKKKQVSAREAVGD